VFSFDAPFYGSAGAIVLNESVVGIAAAANGGGYWLAASDGGIFSYGNAPFYGSVPGVLKPGVRLNKPVVSITADPATGGYWLAASDGGVFSFNAPFYGSTGNLTLNQPVVGITSTPHGGGYRFVARDGGIFDYGTATFQGSAA